MKLELLSSKYVQETNTTRIVVCPENSTACDSTEHTVFHSDPTSAENRAQEVDSFIEELTA